MLILSLIFLDSTREGENPWMEVMAGRLRLSPTVHSFSNSLSFSFLSSLSLPSSLLFLSTLAFPPRGFSWAPGHSIWHLETAFTSIPCQMWPCDWVLSNGMSAEISCLTGLKVSRAPSGRCGIESGYFGSREWRQGWPTSGSQSNLLGKSPNSPEKQFGRSDSGTQPKHLHLSPNQCKWSLPFQKSIIWLQLKVGSVILSLGFCVLGQWLPCPADWFGSWSWCCHTHTPGRRDKTDNPHRRIARWGQSRCESGQRGNSKAVGLVLVLTVTKTQGWVRIPPHWGWLDGVWGKTEWRVWGWRLVRVQTSKVTFSSLSQSWKKHHNEKLKTKWNKNLQIRNG